VATFEERIYSLATEALAEQERQVGELRSRGSTLLAAGAVVASLLAKAVFHGNHPRGVAEVVATVIGLVGAAALLVFVVLLLRPYELGFSVKAGETYRGLWNDGVVEQPGVDLVLAEAFEERRRENADVVERLARSLALALAALVVEAAGLAVAAAVSS
jgi:asparagine N-glycosylation enzyme membrane subunit Stt3